MANKVWYESNFVYSQDEGDNTYNVKFPYRSSPISHQTNREVKTTLNPSNPIPYSLSSTLRDRWKERRHTFLFPPRTLCLTPRPRESGEFSDLCFECEYIRSIVFSGSFVAVEVSPRRISVYRLVCYAMVLLVPSLTSWWRYWFLTVVSGAATMSTSTWYFVTLTWPRFNDTILGIRCGTSRKLYMS
jgi:hypothetical protein